MQLSLHFRAAFVVALASTASNAQEMWLCSVGGPSSESAETVAISADGGYLVAGSTASGGLGSTDALVIKFSSSGDVLWSKAYGGAGGDSVFAVQPVSTGGFILAGSTFSFGSG